MSPILSVQDLHVTFSSQRSSLHAVRGVHFDLHEGETLGIVGESGCGKSAMGRALMGLNPTHTTKVCGIVSYKEQNLLELSERQMQKFRGKEMGMIFQDPMTSLNPTSKIGKQISEGYVRHFPRTPKKIAQELSIEMLKKVGIPYPEERSNAYPHLLSGGMRQRVMIALALACQPKILIADEPTTALDVIIQAQILNLLKTIQQEMKLSILFITHDLGVVAKICDRVLVMYAGQVVESAPVHQLFSSPQHPYTKRLLQTIPRLDREKNSPLLPIEGIPPALTHPLNNCGFCARCEEAMRICTLKSPPLFSVGDQHQSRCFQHEHQPYQTQ